MHSSPWLKSLAGPDVTVFHIAEGILDSTEKAML
jgi:hypothetical protein